MLFHLLTFLFLTWAVSGIDLVLTIENFLIEWALQLQHTPDFFILKDLFDIYFLIVSLVINKNLCCEP